MASVSPRPIPAGIPRNRRVTPDRVIGKLVIGSPISRLSPIYRIGKNNTPYPCCHRYADILSFSNSRQSTAAERVRM